MGTVPIGEVYVEACRLACKATYTHQWAGPLTARAGPGEKKVFSSALLLPMGQAKGHTVSPTKIVSIYAPPSCPLLPWWPQHEFHQVNAKDLRGCWRRVPCKPPWSLRFSFADFCVSPAVEVNSYGGWLSPHWLPLWNTSPYLLRAFITSPHLIHRILDS